MEYRLKSPRTHVTHTFVIVYGDAHLHGPHYTPVTVKWSAAEMSLADVQSLSLACQDEIARRLRETWEQDQPMF